MAVSSFPVPVYRESVRAAMPAEAVNQVITFYLDRIERLERQRRTRTDNSSDDTDETRVHRATHELLERMLDLEAQRAPAHAE